MKSSTIYSVVQDMMPSIKTFYESESLTMRPTRDGKRRRRSNSESGLLPKQDEKIDRKKTRQEAVNHVKPKNNSKRSKKQNKLGRRRIKPRRKLISNVRRKQEKTKRPKMTGSLRNVPYKRSGWKPMSGLAKSSKKPKKSGNRLSRRDCDNGKRRKQRQFGKMRSLHVLKTKGRSKSNEKLKHNDA